MTGASDVSTDLVGSNQIINYSPVFQPFTLARDNSFVRCVSGLGPPGGDLNADLGGWYFNGARLFVPSIGSGCEINDDKVFQVRGANGRRYPGVINLYLCGTFTTTEEGVYSCIMMNSSMMNQTMRVGVYFSGRSKSLDMYSITSLLTIYTAAPMIDNQTSSTVTVGVGSPLIISCTSRGSPPETFTWRKDGGQIAQSTNITKVIHSDTSAVFCADYFINSVTKSDNGTYTCTVTNPIGSDSETITVNVTVGKHQSLLAAESYQGA